MCFLFLCVSFFNNIVTMLEGVSGNISLYITLLRFFTSTNFFYVSVKLVLLDADQSRDDRHPNDSSSSYAGINLELGIKT